MKDNKSVAFRVPKHNKSVAFRNMEAEVARLRKALDDISGGTWDIAREALGRRSWVLADNAKPPMQEREWYMLRLGMAIVGKGKCDKRVPNVHVPVFSAVATDRMAAKRLVFEKLDELFDVFEEGT